MCYIISYSWRSIIALLSEWAKTLYAFFQEKSLEFLSANIHVWKVDKNQECFIMIFYYGCLSEKKINNHIQAYKV